MIDLPPGYADPRPAGHGGFGTVVRAFSEALGCDVALKLPLPDAQAGGLAVELHAAASLRHPNIVQVLDAGVTTEGRDFLAMEYAGEGSFADLVERPPPWPRLLPLLLAVLDALGHAHARGIVHRDVKAENVLLARDMDGALVPRVADFGLAKVLREHGAFDSSRMGAGTMLYMPPEQFDFDLSAVHPGLDLYAFGVLLYRILSGRSPWEDRGLGPLLADKAQGRFDPLVARPGIGAPPGVGDLLSRLLSPDPADRPELAADVRAALLALGARGGEGTRPLDPEPASGPSRELEDSTLSTIPAGQLELPPLPPPLAGRPSGPCLPGIAGVRQPLLAGRRNERQALWDAARAATSGPVGLSVEGARGAGRSRLCRWLLCAMEEQGLARPLHVRADAREDVQGAVVRSLRRLLGVGRMVGVPLRSRVERWAERHGMRQGDAGEIAAWLDPPVQGAGAAGGAPRRADAGDRGLAVLERLLRALSDRGMACAWLEDRNGGTLRDLASALLRLAQADAFPLLVLYEPPGTDDPGGADRPAAFSSLGIGPLPEADMRTLLADLVPDAERACTIAASCGGNPLVAVQSARLPAARSPAQGPGPQPLPVRSLSVAEVAGARIDDFVRHAPDPSACRLLLALLARLPRPAQRATLDVAWSSVAPVGSAMAPVDAACRAGVLCVDRAGGHDFSEPAFAGPARGLAEDVPGIDAACAGAMLDMGQPSPAVLLAAGRLLMETDPGRALELSIRAAGSLAGFDLPAAGAAWEQAGAAAARLGLGPADPRQVAVVLGSARAARNVGDLRATQDILARLDGLALGPPEAAELRFLRCTIAMSRGDLDLVIGLSSGQPGLDLLVLRAEALRRLGRLAEAGAELEAGLALAGRAGDRKSALACAWRLARLRRQQGEMEPALAGFETALAEARALDDPADEAIVLRETGHLHMLAGRLELARLALEGALDRSDRAGLRVETAVTRLSLGELARKAGDPLLARKEYSAALSVAHAYENANLATVALLNLAVTELSIDRVALAARRLDALDRLVPVGGEHAYRAWIEAVRVAVRAAQGAWEEAEAAVLDLQPQAERLRGQADSRELLEMAAASARRGGQLVLEGEALRLALDLARLDGADRACEDLRGRLAALARA